MRQSFLSKRSDSKLPRGSGSTESRNFLFVSADQTAKELPALLIAGSCNGEITGAAQDTASAHPMMQK